MKVKKRDGRIVDFNEQKIIRAILAAFESVDGEVSQYAVDKAYNIASYVSGYFEEDETNTIPGIEEIQDIIEKGLMATKRKDVAKAYILYREERNKIRNKNSALMQSIAEKIDASDVQNQNANVDEHSFGGRMGEARNELMKDYALNYIVSPMAKENHINSHFCSFIYLDQETPPACEGRRGLALYMIFTSHKVYRGPSCSVAL